MSSPVQSKSSQVSPALQLALLRIAELTERVEALEARVSAHHECLVARSSEWLRPRSVQQLVRR